MGSNKRPPPTGHKPRASDSAEITRALVKDSGKENDGEDVREDAPLDPTRVVRGAADQTMAVTPSMMLPIGAAEPPPIPSPQPAATMALTPDMVVGDASLVMTPGIVEAALRVVERWHVAVNAGDADGLVAVCAEDIEIVGPRGSQRGHAVMREWLARAGFSAKPTRWFCGGDGHVVVEQRARWREREGSLGGVIASAFVVRGARIRRYERFEELATAMTMYGLRDVHEIRR